MPKDAAKAWRPLADRTYLQPQVVFGAGASSASPSAAINTASFANALPVNVQLMTLQALSNTTLLVRLSHQFGLGEDATLSLPVTVDVVQLFKAFDIASVEEVSLTNTQSKQELLKRRALHRGWKTEVPAEARHAWRNATLHEGSVTLGPLEIKTFVVTLK